MTATSVVCPECASPVAPGRLSCQSCGTLLASVVGSDRRYASAQVVDPMLPEVDEDRPIASVRRAAPELEPPVEPAPVVALAPSVVAALQPAPPAEPVKRAPRRLTRSKPAAAPAVSTDQDAQTSIFGPVPNVAPPILSDWSGVTDPAATAQPAPVATLAPPVATLAPPVATLAPPVATATRAPKAPREPRPASPARNGNGSAPAAGATLAATVPMTNGSGPSGASVAGAYLAPSATYAAPILDRPAPGPSAYARRAPGVSAAAAAPTWPNPMAGMAPAGASNGTYPGNLPAGPAPAAGAAASLPTVRRMADWLVIGGATLAIVSFVLPWATDGVLGSNGIGYTASWGLANLGHLLLIVVAALVLFLHLVENPVPGWIRSSVLPIAVGGLLTGLAFAYYARPFGGGTGVAVLLAGAVLLLVGGVAASRPERNEASAPTV